MFETYNFNNIKREKIQIVKNELSNKYYNSLKTNILSTTFKYIYKNCKSHQEIFTYYLNVKEYLSSLQFKQDIINKIYKELSILFSRQENLYLNITSNDINIIVNYSISNFFEKFKNDLIDIIDVNIKEEKLNILSSNLLFY